MPMIPASAPKHRPLLNWSVTCHRGANVSAFGGIIPLLGANSAIPPVICEIPFLQVYCVYRRISHETFEFRNSPKFNSCSQRFETSRTSSTHSRLQDIENRIEIGQPVQENSTRFLLILTSFILLHVLGIGTRYRQKMAATTRYSAKNRTRYSAHPRATN